MRIHTGKHPRSTFMIHILFGIFSVKVHMRMHPGDRPYSLVTCESFSISGD